MINIQSVNNFFTKASVLFAVLLCQSFVSQAQNPIVQIDNGDFEESTVNPWLLSLGSGIKLSTDVVHSGKQALEVIAGSTAQMPVSLQPNSRYKVSAWLKNNSGASEVQLNIRGLNHNNISIASALADWKKLEQIFNTEDEQTAIIEIFNPDSPNHLSAWADDIIIEYIEPYIPVKQAGIKPLSTRVCQTELGISQQPLEKLKWLLDAKFGMFIHWGLYSGSGKAEWYMENNGISPEEYRKLAYPESGDLYFAADNCNPEDWASLAEEAGMKYMCMVTMHHDGYALFNSKAMGAFTSKQTHNRDFIKEYADACRKHNMKVGLYKTLINWRYPGYYDVTGADCKPNKFGYVTDPAHKENARLMKNELYCQVKELMTNYGKIDIIFWDGGWLGQQGSDADGAYFWESGKYLDPNNDWPVDSCLQDFDQETGKPLGIMGMVRKYQSDIVVNARTGWMGDFKSEEGGQPISGPIRSEDVWEKCMTMASGWGYTPAHNDSSKVISCDGVKRMLADCVIRNMTLLLNVGPDQHGKITDVEANVLRQTGQWLRQVGDAVYGTRGGPWNPKDGEYGYAWKNKTIYIYLLNGFKGKDFVLPAINKGQKVMRAYSVTDGNVISFKQKNNEETILKDFKQSDKDVTILAVELNKAVMSDF